MIQFRLCASWHLQRRWREVVDEGRRLLALDRSPACTMWVAIALMRDPSEDPDTIIGLMRDATETGWDFAPFWAARARAEKRFGRSDDALTSARRAYALMSNVPEYGYLTADLFEQTGHVGEALDIYWHYFEQGKMGGQAYLRLMTLLQGDATDARMNMVLANAERALDNKSKEHLLVEARKIAAGRK